METPDTQNTFENDEGSPKITPEMESLSSDKETFGNRHDESQILADQDLTNEHDISALDENMGAISNSMDTLEDEPDEFIQGDVDVVTQMGRTTRAMDAAIDESSGRRAHVKLDQYKTDKTRSNY